MEEKHDDKEIKHEHSIHEKKEGHHTEHKEHHEVKHHKKKLKKITVWQTAAAVLGILLIISLTTGGFGLKTKTAAAGEELTVEEAADKAITYINTNLLQPGTTAKIVSSEDKGDLYNIKMDIGGNEFDSYVTKDGGLLFPSVVDMNLKLDEPETETETQEPPVPSTEKSDKPTVELFVMSHCPFGTQAEKGMIPVAELLGNKIDFEIKFVNYAMHGEKEVTEQLNQHCIKTEEPDKFLPYLKCFLKDGDGETCLTEIGIDEGKLEACTEKTDTEFKITESLEDQSTWSGGRFPQFLINDAECKAYGIRGSPGLVINGKSVSSARSPAAYLATICGAFNEPPAECEQELDTANPSSGFGYEAGTASASAAQCG